MRCHFLPGPSWEKGSWSYRSTAQSRSHCMDDMAEQDLIRTAFDEEEVFISCSFVESNWTLIRTIVCGYPAFGQVPLGPDLISTGADLGVRKVLSPGSIVV